MTASHDDLVDELRALSSRSAEILRNLDFRGSTPQVVSTSAPSYGSYARSIINGRARIEEFFPASLFADPAFDILLDLFASAAEGSRANVKSVSIAARVPATTAIRWIDLLVDKGLVTRSQHQLDRRNVLLSLSPWAHERMEAYLAEISSIPLRRD